MSSPYKDKEEKIIINDFLSLSDYKNPLKNIKFNNSFD